MTKKGEKILVLFWLLFFINNRDFESDNFHKNCSLGINKQVQSL